MASSKSKADRVARLVARWLRRVLPSGAADHIIGDLLEHADRRPHGRRRWLVIEALKLTWGFTRRASAAEPRPSTAVRVEAWLRDGRYALRSLGRSRGFSAVALTSLALGIGLATAVFSVVDGLLLRPLPYGESDAIVRVREVAVRPGPAGDAVERGLLRHWLSASRTIGAFGPYAVFDARLRVGDQSWVGVQVDVGEQFFEVMRASPLHGRFPGRADADKGAPMVAVLSHAFWRTAFGGRPDAIGRRLSIDDRPVVVVGVLPESFVFPSAAAAVYLPGRTLLPDFEPGIARAFFAPPLELVARLREGASPSTVEEEWLALAASRGRTTAAGVVVTRLQDDLVRWVRPALIVLLAAVACVLAIVCVNLTNLLLARGTTRQREIAVRAALGASRAGMARPLVLEGLLLAGLGGGAGLLLASALLTAAPLAASIDPVLASQVRIDGRVVMFALVVTGLVGVVVGMVPVWLTPTGDIRGAISGGPVLLLSGTAVRAERARAGLVVVQVALAIVLAVGASLLSRSLVTLVTVDLGFNPSGALGAQVRLPSGGGAWGWSARFYEDFVARLQTLPGVEAAGFTTSLPMQETFSEAAIRIDGIDSPPSDSPLRIHREIVTPEYFRALGLPVTRGRAFEPRDVAAGERVAIVNEALAASLLPSRDPLNHRVMLFGEWARIVGVVSAKRHTGLRSEVRPEVYAPLAQSPPDVVNLSAAGIVIRTAGNPAAFVPAVRSTLRGLQPTAALEHEGVLAEAVWASTAEPRFYASVMGTFAVLAIVTALVGLFGVLSFLVERRRVEIGVRRALGATSRDISNLVLGRALTLVGLAAPIGLAGALGAAGLLRSLLFGVEPIDPASFAAVMIGVPVVALAACLWPARRAVTIEPLDALREQ